METEKNKLMEILAKLEIEKNGLTIDERGGSTPYYL